MLITLGRCGMSENAEAALIEAAQALASERVAGERTAMAKAAEAFLIAAFQSRRAWYESKRAA